MCLLVFPQHQPRTPPSRLAAAIFTIIFWITLPWFFSWMYFCNSGNTVWLASLGAMFLIYYHLTDWRIATLGIVSGRAGGVAAVSGLRARRRPAMSLGTAAPPTRW